MKRLISLLLIPLFLLGCGQRIITSSVENAPQDTLPTQRAPQDPALDREASTPLPTATPRPTLSTYGPKEAAEALFPEELLSHDGEPISSELSALLSAKGLSKSEFYDRFSQVIRRIESLDRTLLELAEKGRTLTKERKEKTADALSKLLSDETLLALQSAFSSCPGDSQELPVREYVACLSALVRDVRKLEDRTVPFFSLGNDAVNDYKTVLSRYMGEPVVPQDIFVALDRLVETEAYALAAALTTDPEVARKKETISYGSYEQDMAFLRKIAETLCPLPDGAELPDPSYMGSTEDMDLLELAFRRYPGMAFLNLFAAHSSEEQQMRWANAPYGYLAGIAVHRSFAVIPYLDGIDRNYVQYRWYEDMLFTTMTGISALLVHYYGYTDAELKEYLKSSGAEAYADVLYEKAMFDPFESLIASYGYYRYLDICQAALDAGCNSEQAFLQDYLSVGPAPYAQLKQYMVDLYKNQG